MLVMQTASALFSSAVSLRYAAAFTAALLRACKWASVCSIQLMIGSPTHASSTVLLCITPFTHGPLCFPHRRLYRLAAAALATAALAAAVAAAGAAGAAEGAPLLSNPDRSLWILLVGSAPTCADHRASCACAFAAALSPGCRAQPTGACRSRTIYGACTHMLYAALTLGDGAEWGSG